MSDENTQPEAPDAGKQVAPGATAEGSQAQLESTEEIALSAKDAKNAAADTSTVQLAEGSSKLAKLAKRARKKSGGKLILVPIDFSAHSEDALLFAARLAKMTSASLMVLHVVHDPGEMPGYYAELVKRKRAERIQDIAGDVFGDFMKRTVKKHHNLKPLAKAARVMVVGLPVTRILQVVEAVDPFMVVMGSQGRTGLKHLFLGSKAEQVVQLCPAPVTIVKQKQ